MLINYQGISWTLAKNQLLAVTLKPYNIYCWNWLWANISRDTIWRNQVLSKSMGGMFLCVCVCVRVDLTWNDPFITFPQLVRHVTSKYIAHSCQYNVKNLAHEPPTVHKCWVPQAINCVDSSSYPCRRLYVRIHYFRLSYILEWGNSSSGWVSCLYHASIICPNFLKLSCRKRKKQSTNHQNMIVTLLLPQWTWPVWCPDWRGPGTRVYSGWCSHCCTHWTILGGGPFCLPLEQCESWSQMPD